MIQDIFPHKFNNRYDPDATAQAWDFILRFCGNRLLVMEENGSFRFPTVAELGGGCFTYLFTVDQERYFLSTGDVTLSEGMEYMEIQVLRKTSPMPKHRIFAAITGKHLADWYRDAQFCGRCGKKMTHSSKERAMVCHGCGNTVYPRIMPAVIVGVRNGDRLLLTRYRTGFPHNALIAGFTEIGETLEETVAREVMEEAGLKVKNIQYYKSQPWGLANDILAGFYCDVDGDTEIHMDAQELRLAQWTDREEIVLQPDDFSLTNEMMKEFKEGRQ